MTEHLSADEAAERFLPTDKVGMGLAMSQPPDLLTAMGRRTDWVDLRIYAGFLTVLTELYSHPNVHNLSVFFGPLERILRDSGANMGFAAADYRRFKPMLRSVAPRVMATTATMPDDDGWCSLSLHAGHTVEELHLAGADPDRVLVVEASAKAPRTRGYLPEHRHAVHIDEIDIFIESEKGPVTLPDAAPSDVERAIAEHVHPLVPDGATIQTGFGAGPSVIASLLAEGEGGDYGIHSEMFTSGLMRLHQAGKVTNRKGQFDGVSVATFASGPQEMYDWLDGNEEVAFLPVEVVNSPLNIRRNRSMVTINAAISIDIQGQVVADTIGGNQYSGIGGHEDFVSGPSLSLEARSILIVPSTVTIGDRMRSRIVPWFEAGTVITTPRHQVDTVVTEYGVAELQGKTVRQRGQALASIAHPAFRDGLMEAAERASGGRSPVV